MSVPVESLVESRIWLTVKKDNKNFLYGFVNPSVIELYQEGKYKGDFLARCKPFSSVRLLPCHEQLGPWSLPFNSGDGVRECTESEQAVLLETIEKNRRVGFAPPAHAMLDAVSLIASIDPMAKYANGSLLKSSKEISRAVSSLPPVVDTFLEEIDPEKISPRTFIARSESVSLEWLDKTNDAE